MSEEKQDALAKPTNAWMAQAQSVTTGTNLNPSDLPSIVGLAQMLQKSPLLPKALNGDLGGTVWVLSQAAQMGLPWTVGLKELYVVNNKVNVQARLLRALVERDPNCLQFYVKDATETRCTVVCQRRGMAQPVEISYTIEDAKKAGLTEKNPNYKTRPREMLIARASSLAANTYFPSVCLGLDLEEPETVYGGTAEIIVEPPPVILPKRRGRPPKPDPLAAFEPEPVARHEEPMDVDEIYPGRDETVEPVVLPEPEPVAQERPGGLLIDQRPPMDQSGEVDVEDATIAVDFAVRNLGEADAKTILRRELANAGISGYSKLTEGVQKLTAEGYARLLMTLRAEAKKREAPMPKDENDKPRRGRLV